MTLAQMRDQLELTVRNLFPGGYVQITPTLLDSWINSGYHEIDRDLRWSRCAYTFSTVANQAEYVAPVEVREKLTAEFTDLYSKLTGLLEISVEDYRDKRVENDEAGTPRFYAHHGDKLYLYPKPDATIAGAVKLWIVTEPPVLADTDAPGFPAHLHQRVIDYATIYVLRHFGQYIQAVSLREHLHQEIMLERKEPAVHRGGNGRAKTSGW